MNAKILLVALMLLAIGLVRADELLDVSQLPAPVQQVLKSSGKLPVKQVTIRNVGGQTIYDIEFEEKNRPNRRLRVGADGAIIRDWEQLQSSEELARAAAVASSGEFAVPVYIPKVNFEELPAAVQQTVTKEAAGRQISDIKTDTVDGRKAYLVEFRERGRNPRLYVGLDGSLLRPEEKPPASPFGTSFAGTPRAVQETIRREVGDQEIVKIDKRGFGTGPKIYSVEIKGSAGVFELRIAEDGRIQNDSRRDTNRPDVR